MNVTVAVPVGELRSALSVTIVPDLAYSFTCWPALHRTFPPPNAPIPSVCRLNWVPVVALPTCVRIESTHVWPAGTKRERQVQPLCPGGHRAALTHLERIDGSGIRARQVAHRDDQNQ